MKATLRKTLFGSAKAEAAKVSTGNLEIALSHFEEEVVILPTMSNSTEYLTSK